MKEYQKQLEELQRRIVSTWELLDIDRRKTAMHALEIEMQATDFWEDQARAARTGKRHERLRAEVMKWEELRTEVASLISLAEQLATDWDEELEKELIQKIPELETRFTSMEFTVLFSGKRDADSAMVAVHAGSGGTEAQDWAAMLLRMILRYAEKKEWTVTMLDTSEGQEAGIKSAVFRVEGSYVFGHLKSEHGTHRLVRISPFDAEQMRHTSFALIEVIPEVEEVTIQIDPKDLRIDTFMSGGKGGQSVNTTYSAVRIVHIPTNISVQCQNERSQLQNKETAMKMLASKLQARQDEEEEAERLKLRGEYKSAEWGNQIRSYVLHPYKLVKDVRTGYETTDPEAVLSGDLDPFIEAYLRYERQRTQESH